MNTALEHPDYRLYVLLGLGITVTLGILLAVKGWTNPEGAWTLPGSGAGTGAGSVPLSPDPCESLRLRIDQKGEDIKWVKGEIKENQAWGLMNNSDLERELHGYERERDSLIRRYDACRKFNGVR